MYSRRLGVTNDEESRKSLEKFNHSLREQYMKKKASVVEQEKSVEKEIETPSKEMTSYISSAKDIIKNLDIKIDYDTILIVGLILLLLTDSDSVDLVLLGILASLIL